ncbi:MAG: hypothetical protein AB1505_20640 [Candidatus Latescibacterota bacterium]
MPIQAKLERAARQNPRSVRIQQLVAILEGRGFECRRTTGGHWQCYQPGLRLDVQLAEPHGKGDRFVRVAYVRKALRAVDAVVAAEEI